MPVSEPREGVPRCAPQVPTRPRDQPDRSDGLARCFIAQQETDNRTDVLDSTTSRKRMKAAWYDRQGPADDILHAGTLPDPFPPPGEVRVRLTFSGINPGDTKKRRGWLDSAMPFPLVIPHSDGAGRGHR